MSARLPDLPRTTDHGYVYVVRLGEAYKVGFTRNALQRRVRACFGRLEWFRLDDADLDWIRGPGPS